jgi:hypothetical protein
MRITDSIFGIGLLAALAGATAAGVPVAAQAQTVPSGSANLRGKGAFAVQRCGRDRGRVTLAMSVAADGTWTAFGPLGSFSGSAVPRGGSGRTLDLDFDAQSLDAFIAALVVDASDLCKTGVVPTDVRRQRFRLRLDRKRTKARLVLRYRFAGTAAGRRGRAAYRLTARGPWTSP